MTDADKIREFLAALEPILEDSAPHLAARSRALFSSYADKLQVRDDRLRALRRHERYRGLSHAGTARAMAADLMRYYSVRWPRERGSLTAPSAEPARTAHLILSSGAPLPRWRQILRILSSASFK